MSGALTQCFKKRVFCLITNPRRGITIAWIISLVLVFIAFIVSCVAASRMANGNNSAYGANNAAAFAAVWTALLLIFISILGTIIMRRYKSALPIGFFLGIVFVMSQQMLILFAIYVDRIGKIATTPATTTQQAQQAMAVFSFFLFLIYGFFGLLLSVFRNDVIVEDTFVDKGYSDSIRDTEQPPEYN